MEPPHDPEQHLQGGGVRSRSVWTVLFVLSVVALTVVVNFGSGIVAERYLFSGTWLGTDRLIGGLETDGNPEVDAAFPRQAEVRELLEDEYFFLPASPEARARFWADVEQGAMEGMAIAAATPVASLDDYRRELDYGADSGIARGSRRPARRRRRRGGGWTRSERGRDRRGDVAHPRPGGFIGRAD